MSNGAVKALNARMHLPQTYKEAAVWFQYDNRLEDHPQFAAIRYLPAERTFYQYQVDRGFYAELEKTELEALASDSLSQLYFTPLTKGGSQPAQRFEPTSGNIAELVNQLRIVSLISVKDIPPFWLDTKGLSSPDPKSLIVCENRIVSCTAGRTLEHTPRYFSTREPTFVYEPNYQPRRWLEFLNEVFGNDRVAIRALQQWFGYVVSGDNRLRTIMLLYGVPASGKGTICSVLEGLVGHEYTASPETRLLTTQFGLQSLIDKRLAILQDHRQGNFTDTATLLERLLSISGGDRMTTDRKNRPAYTGKFGCRFMLVSNTVPNLGDRTGALSSRLLVLHLSRSIQGKYQDPNLKEKLNQELGGILAWAIQGRLDLTKQVNAGHRFVQPKSGRSTLQKIDGVNAPVLEFVRNRVKAVPGRRAYFDEIFELWEDYQVDHNLDAVKRQPFGRRFREAIKTVLGLELKRSEGTNKRLFYSGIRLFEADITPTYPDDAEHSASTLDTNQPDRPLRSDTAPNQTRQTVYISGGTWGSMTDKEINDTLLEIAHGKIRVIDPEEEDDA